MLGTGYWQVLRAQRVPRLRSVALTELVASAQCLDSRSPIDHVMSDRPSQLWKELPAREAPLAGRCLLAGQRSPEIQAQHVEALVAIARRLNFRAKSVQALPVERRAKHLAQMRDVSDALATPRAHRLSLRDAAAADGGVPRRARHRPRRGVDHR